MVFASSIAFAGDSTDMVKKAVERSTLNRAGTPAFHLKASFGPTYPDREPKHSGTIEIWWTSPTTWKREIHSAEFNQVAISDDGKEWQKNDTDLFPEWLRELTVELVSPVPDLDRVLSHVKEADQRQTRAISHFSWVRPSSDGKVQKTIGAGMSINGATGLLDFGSDIGWDGEFLDYQKFHGKFVARTIKLGHDNITAHVDSLEDLSKGNSGIFQPPDRGDPPIHTVIVDELALRKNLMTAAEPEAWPPVDNGPFEGILTAEALLDRNGKVREIRTLLSDNGGVSGAAQDFMLQKMRFTPYEVNGVPVQVLSRITMPFKTSRPAGAENFESARAYFEKARRVGFPAAAQGMSPYILKANFKTATAAGQIVEGEYIDSWKSPTEWRREATLGNSRYVRARNGEKLYQSSEGETGVLQFVFRVMEPIPALDSFVESDWRIKRESLNGTNAIRVLTGYEAPDGKLDPEQVRGFWFDDDGRLLKTFFQGVESRRSDFRAFAETQIAHTIAVGRDGKTGLLIQVLDVEKADAFPAGLFDLPGHNWTRAFTDQAR